jgi:hypothetical protein
VSQRELRATFASGWQVPEIVPTGFETNLESGEVRAWRATIGRA